MALIQHNDRSTIHLKGISSEVDEDLLFELGTQFGIVKRVHIPMNKLTMQKEEFAFIEFNSAADAIYMKDVIHQSVAPLRLFNKSVTVSYQPTATGGNKELAAAADALLNIGANIIVSNLDRKMVDLQKLQVHFSDFGRLSIPPKIHELGSGAETCNATICFTTFDASDAAIRAFDGHFLFGRKVRVEYAMREDGKGRHGTEEERMLYRQKKDGAAVEDVPPPTMMMPNQQQQQQADNNNADWAQGLNPYTAI